jgi:hypothetical protein
VRHDAKQPGAGAERAGRFCRNAGALLLAAQAYRQIGMEEGVREVEEELAGLPESE